MIAYTENNLPASSTDLPAGPITVKCVKVRTAPNGWEVQSSHPIAPTCTDVVYFLPKEHQRAVAHLNGCTLDYCVAKSGIPPVVWQNAIAAEIAHRRDNSAEPTDATVVAGFTQDAYLGIGDGIYKLQPVAIAPACKALAVIRKRAITLAKRDAELLIADANKSVAGIHAEAQRRMEEAIKRQNAAQAAARVLARPPQWLADCGLGYRYNHVSLKWIVACYVKFKIERFELIYQRPYVPPATINPYYKKTWAAVAQLPFNILLWTPIADDGSYRPNDCFLDTSNPLLPHLRYTASCMAPAAMPTAILSYADLLQWASDVGRCLRVVDIGSLYNCFENWDTRAKAMTPLVLAEALRQHPETPIVAAITVPANTDVPFDMAADERATFQARTA